MRDFNANFRNLGGQPILPLNPGLRGGGGPFLTGQGIEPILNIDCGQTVVASIDSNSGFSYYRTQSITANQAYKARLVSLRVDSVTSITLSVTAGFGVYMTLVRNSEQFWVSNTGSISLDVTQELEGPFTLEITTINPGILGPFSLQMQCGAPVGLVGYWTFDETSTTFHDRVDRLASPRRATGTGTSQDLRPVGLQGNCLRFLGSGGGPNGAIVYDNITSSSQLGFNPDPDISFFGWFKLTTAPTASVGPQIGIGATNLLGLVLGTGNTNNTITIQAFGNGFVNGSVNLTITPSVWHFFHIYYDSSSNSVFVQIDNGLSTLVKSGITLGPSSQNGLNVSFGNTGGTETAADAEFDEVGLVVGFNLTTSQLTSIYNGGAAITWPGILTIVQEQEIATAYWRFEDGAAPWTDYVTGIQLADIGNPSTSVSGIISNGLGCISQLGGTQVYADVFSWANLKVVDYDPADSVTEGASLSVWWKYVTHSTGGVPCEIDVTFQDSGGIIQEGFQLIGDPAAINPTVTANFFKLHGAIDGGLTLGTLTINTWHHIVAVYNQSNHTAMVYLDGVLVGSVILSSWVVASNAGINIQNPGDAYFHLYVDELAIYHTRVLSQSDVATLFNLGVGKRPYNG